jgi:hypothetical protein
LEPESSSWAERKLGIFSVALYLIIPHVQILQWRDSLLGGRVGFYCIDLSIFVSPVGQNEICCFWQFWGLVASPLVSHATYVVGLDIGGALYGPYMRYAILTSIVISQIGFVAAYMIFVSENLRVRSLFPLSDLLNKLTYFVSGFRNGNHELHEDHTSATLHSHATCHTSPLCID